MADKHSSLVTSDYHGAMVQFNQSGWINATSIADRFGKKAVDWLRQTETAEYVAALADSLGNDNSGFLPQFNEIIKLESSSSREKLLRLVKKTGLVKTKAGPLDVGGGTWLHPKLGVVFARWLDVRFAIWCDLQMDSLIRGSHPALDWGRLRHEAAASHKVMCAILKLSRDEEGKETAPHHYVNESRLVSWALSGEFKTVDRNALTACELDILVRLEEQNALLIGRGVDYRLRKPRLETLAKALALKGVALA